ncbi:MFS transporter [Mycobacterium paraterrae]|uniref:MFS transporter n=1 Tax=Mycobacterium paraterrae TaxID=577492 RepID=A0ABY3VU53_9MYCO|nr:MFS transporter [Mycobacterium paraterrae]UMB72150.1 MFS transporter [Mycobacterium paraterrae]
MRRVAAACMVGSAIEFYDFLIYGTAAALVFPTVFFPDLSPTLATIASMGTFASAFVSRPVGGAAFGYLGDRLGRKRSLIATLLIMATATVSVGLVPTTASIGAAAPFILVALRLIQGFAAGGEWAGSALLSIEYAPADRRGRYGMFTLLGGGLAALLTSLTFLSVNLSIGESSEAFLRWGWRIPFLVSSVLVGIALYVRLRIDETPVFAAEEARHLTPKAPLRELLRSQPREVALGGGSILSGMTFVYMAHTYLPHFAHSDLGYSRTFIWTVGALGGLASMTVVAISAVLSDRLGRRRTMMLGWAGCLLWAPAVIPLIETGKPVCYAVAVIGMLGIANIGSGPTGAFIPELFATRWRYSGAALAVNLAGVAGGALPPLLAGTLQASYGAWAIGPMLAVTALVSLGCTYTLPETKDAALQPDSIADAVPTGR